MLDKTVTLKRKTLGLAKPLTTYFQLLFFFLDDICLVKEHSFKGKETATT